MTPAPRVLVTGEYCCDLIFAGLDGLPRLGGEVFAETLDILPGGTFNIAAGVAALDVPTAWGCDFGTDIFSAEVRRAADAAGIDPRAYRDLDRPLPRVSAAFSDAVERGFISASPGAIRPPEPDDLAPDWLIQTFRVTPDWRAFAAGMKARGARVFGDCRDCDLTLDSPGVREHLALLDVFSPNESEAMALTGVASAAEALDVLAALTPVVAIKCGPEGARWAQGAARGHVQAPAVAALDSVGAGDAFDAGMVAGLLGGLALDEAVTAGVLLGSRMVTRRGGSDAASRAGAMDFAREAGMTLPGALKRALEGGFAPPAREETGMHKIKQGVRP